MIGDFVSDIELVDGHDILQAVVVCNVSEVVELAIARAREYDRPVHVWFVYNTTKITVAADSDQGLICGAYNMQVYRPAEAGRREVGPYPTDLIFDWAKSKTHQLIHDDECLSVWAYQLDQDGWVELVNESGQSTTRWYAFRTDWFVKDCRSSAFLIVPAAEWQLCPCPSHK